MKSFYSFLLLSPLLILNSNAMEKEDDYKKLRANCITKEEEAGGRTTFSTACESLEIEKGKDLENLSALSNAQIFTLLRDRECNQWPYNLLSEIRKRAESGDTEAQTNFGFFMYKARRAGFPQSPEADQHTVVWLANAAEQGKAVAQTIFGIMHSEGRAGFAQGPEADQHAVIWLTKAAEQGYAVAQRNLGNMYKAGRAGLPKVESDRLAIKWYTEAAKQGHAAAQANLGFMYEEGRTGVPQGPEADQHAVVCYTNALKSNSKLATVRQALQKFFICDLSRTNLAISPEGPQIDIEELKGSLEGLKDHHIFLEGFAGGGFDQGFGENPYLKSMSHQIGSLSNAYIELLAQISEPGFLISCLDINPSLSAASPEMVANKQGIAGLYFKLKEDFPLYLCLVSPHMIGLLKSTELHEKLEDLYEIYGSSLTILHSIFSMPQLGRDKIMEGLLLGLKYAKESRYFFLKAFLEPYQGAKEEPEKNLALQEIIKKLEEHHNLLQDQREFCKEINSMVLDIIKKSEPHRNHLFITRIWNE